MVRKSRRLPILAIVFALIVTAAVGFYSISSNKTTSYAEAAFKPLSIYKPLHSLPGNGAVSAQITSASARLTTWSSSFSFQGKNYPYTMVGTNPRNGSQTTTVPVDIIPLVFKFSNGTAINGSSVVGGITSSALFRNSSFVTGNTQYLDAFQRGEFWNTVSTKSPNYHVLLGTPSVKAAVTLSVPAASGRAQKDSKGNTIGLVDINWFAPVADKLAVKNNAPSHLVIFSAVNIYGYIGTVSQCCIGGYHTAVQSGGNTYTYAYAEWDQAHDVFKDIDALSHEVAEWGSDPLVNNTTPNWFASNYGCSNSLEVGDPAVGTDFVIGNLHYQDEVYFSWFARQSPSQAYKGRYDYLGTLYKSPAKGC